MSCDVDLILDEWFVDAVWILAGKSDEGLGRLPNRVHHVPATLVSRKNQVLKVGDINSLTRGLFRDQAFEFVPRRFTPLNNPRDSARLCHHHDRLCRLSTLTLVVCCSHKKGVRENQDA